MPKKKRAVERQIKEILVKARLNGVSLETEVESLILFLDEQLEAKEQQLMEELQARQNPVDHSMIEEIYDTYPQYLSEAINGNKAIAKGIKPYTIEQLGEMYCKAIKNDDKRHKQIKELILFGIKHNLIKFGFSSFIISRDWERLELSQLKQNQLSSGGYGLRKAT